VPVVFPFSFPAGFPSELPPVPPNPLVIVQKQSQPTATQLGLGQDFSFLTVLDPRFSLIGGNANLGQALAHRLETPRGGLFYDKNYGTDVRGRLNKGMSAQDVQQLCADASAECLKDERVLSVSASCQLVNGTLALVLNGASAAGPFNFVLGVSGVSVTLLAQNPNS
jgi:hypothetical protein